MKQHECCTNSAFLGTWHVYLFKRFSHFMIVTTLLSWLQNRPRSISDPPHRCPSSLIGKGRELVFDWHQCTPAHSCWSFSWTLGCTHTFVKREQLKGILSLWYISSTRLNQLLPDLRLHSAPLYFYLWWKGPLEHFSKAKTRLEVFDE